jgi:hypothetical protein
MSSRSFNRRWEPPSGVILNCEGCANIDGRVASYTPTQEKIASATQRCCLNVVRRVLLNTMKGNTRAISSPAARGGSDCSAEQLALKAPGIHTTATARQKIDVFYTERLPLSGVR